MASQIVPFNDDGIQKRANTEWQKLASSQNLTGDQAYLNSYQHIAVEGRGYCSLTAMATYHGMKTSELIKHLHNVAEKNNLKPSFEKMLKIMANESAGIEPNEYNELFDKAGLSFRVLTLDPGNGGISPVGFVGTAPEDADRAPALLFTRQQSGQGGHYDLLAPRGHLANQVTLPTDAKSYVMNDYKQN